jgi:hypothetical protein
MAAVAFTLPELATMFSVQLVIGFLLGLGTGVIIGPGWRR